MPFIDIQNSIITAPPDIHYGDSIDTIRINFERRRLEELFDKKQDTTGNGGDGNNKNPVEFDNRDDDDDNCKGIYSNIKEIRNDENFRKAFKDHPDSWEMLTIETVKKLDDLLGDYIKKNCYDNLESRESAIDLKREIADANKYLEDLIAEKKANQNSDDDDIPDVAAFSHNDYHINQWVLPFSIPLLGLPFLLKNWGYAL